MRNLDPVLIERANQVSFSGGVGIWSTANILTRYLAFPPVFLRLTISKRINAFSFAPASKDGRNSFIRLILTGSGDELNLCLGWWPEGQTIISKKRKSSLMPSGARKNRSPQRWPLISIIPPINWRGLFPPRGRSKPMPMAVMIPSLPTTRWRSKSCKPALII